MLQQPIFIKVGNRVINPWLIASIDLNHSDKLSENNIVIFYEGRDFDIFRGQEANTLRAYFLHGSRTIDLDNLYGTTAQGGNKQW